MASTSEYEPVRITNINENGGFSDSETELIKIEFNKKLQEHFVSTSNSEIGSIISNLWSRKCVKFYMLKIKEALKLSLDTRYINTYRDISKIDKDSSGKERLLIKDEDGKLKDIVPWEDKFDIYWKAHLRYGHPNTRTLKLILQPDYIVNDFAIQTVCEVCYACLRAQEPNYRYSLDLISVDGTTNFAFALIMVCEDMYTGFIHLRPLSLDTRVNEICMELLKIFMDFGPPKEVFVSNTTFEIALDQIKHLTIFAPFPINVIKAMPIYEKLNRLSNKISIWMTKNKFNNWSIGCYAVQLQMNNENKEPYQKSAYSRVFRELKSYMIEEVEEMERDSTEFPTSSDVKVGEGVSARSLDEFDALSYTSAGRSAARASTNTSSTAEAPETDESNSAVKTKFMVSSDEEMFQFDDKDPLAIDDTEN